MQKFTISFSVALLCLLGLLDTANAQLRRSSFRVDAPASIEGYKIIDEIDSTSASPWGTGIDSIWEGYTVAYDPANADGCVAFAPNYFDGKFALIFRGGCEFGAKALAAQNAGAKGVIIVNNLLGVVGMGAGAAGLQVEIPVVMVTTADGQAMRDQITAGNNVVVSLTDWRFDPTVNPIDVGFLSDGPVFPIARAIPEHQVSTAKGIVDNEFRLFAGSRFYNFSVNTWDSLYQRGELSYRSSLTTGAFTPKDTNDILWTFNAPGVESTDSVITVAIDTVGGVEQGFLLDDELIGTYRMENSMSVENTGAGEVGLPALNNVNTYDFAINDSIYSKCEYDFTKKRPVVNSYVNATNAEWGPILYFRNGGYIAKTAQVVIMRDVITDSVFAAQNVDVKLYKWSDDIGGAGEGVLDYATEIDEVGFGSYALTSTDIVPIEGLALNIPLENSLSTNTPIQLDELSKYWLTVTVVGGTGGFGIGTDYYSDYSANLNLGLSEGSVLNTTTGTFGGGFANAGSPSIALVTVPLPAVANGINDVNVLQNAVKVYPNPVKNVLNISLDLPTESRNVTIEVVDVTGKVISSTSKSSITNGNFGFNTSSLANGTYFVRVIANNASTQIKFVVSK